MMSLFFSVGSVICSPCFRCRFKYYMAESGDKAIAAFTVHRTTPGSRLPTSRIARALPKTVGVKPSGDTSVTDARYRAIIENGRLMACLFKSRQCAGSITSGSKFLFPDDHVTILSKFGSFDPRARKGRKS
jgi:hypothetical protein